VDEAEVTGWCAGRRDGWDSAGRAVQGGFITLEAALVAVVVWSQHGASNGLFWLDVVVGAATVVLLPLLRTRLTTVGVLAAVLAALSAAATPVSSLTVLLTAQCRRLSFAVRLAALAAAAQLVRATWRPIAGLDFSWWTVEVCAVATALIGWGAYSRSRHALIASLRERARRAEAEQVRRIAEARVAERGRIAREMHDVLAHRLTLLATYSGALEYRPETSPEKISEAAGVIRSTVREALVELRQIIYMLRDEDQEDEVRDVGAGEVAAGDVDGGDVGGRESGGRGVDGGDVGGRGVEGRGFDGRVDGGGIDGRVGFGLAASAGDPGHGFGLGRPQPGLADLPQLADESRGVGAEVHLDLRVAEPRQCPAVVGRTAYRVVQEGLTNARRHAPGVPVLVVIGGRRGELLTVEVHNALVERRPEAAELGTGTGLIGLTERVSLAGGRVEYGPTDGEFRLRVQLPWSA
jgi:signal transduction histidine kinase